MKMMDTWKIHNLLFNFKYIDYLIDFSLQHIIVIQLILIINLLKIQNIDKPGK